MWRPGGGTAAKAIEKEGMRENGRMDARDPGRVLGGPGVPEFYVSVV